MIDPDFVRLVYQGLLEREAETGAADYWAASPHTPETFLKAVVRTPEFEALHSHRVIDPYFEAAPRPIDVHVTAEQLAALFERTHRQWTELGDTEPYWSVLTHEDFRTRNLDAGKLEAFYASGAGHAALVDRSAERAGLPAPSGTCLELGCGVGRVTKHLAARFERVIAVDVSKGNLRCAREMAEREGLGNIEFVHAQTMADLTRLSGFDLFYSFIVLQHNTPPIQHAILDWAFGGLNPGGYFLFQTQTWNEHYQFRVDDYLKAAPDLMDMHSLPMHDILGLAAAHGCVPADVREDSWTGRFGSHTFFGRARA